MAKLQERQELKDEFQKVWEWGGGGGRGRQEYLSVLLFEVVVTRPHNGTNGKGGVPA